MTTVKGKKEQRGIKKQDCRREPTVCYSSIFCSPGLDLFQKGNDEDQGANRQRAPDEKSSEP